MIKYIHSNYVTFNFTSVIFIIIIIACKHVVFYDFARLLLKTLKNQLREWFGPENVRTRDITADVRVGGKYRWNVITQDGEEWAAIGEYRIRFGEENCLHVAVG